MRLNLNCSQYKKKQWLCDLMKVLANPTIVIIVEYTNVADQQIYTSNL